MSDLSIKKTNSADSLKLNSIPAPVPLARDSASVNATSLKNDNFNKAVSLNASLKVVPELENIFAGKGELKPGATGNSVTVVQRGLMILGYKEITKIDGSFGKKGSTKTAIEHFQKDQGLEVTSKIDKNTLTKLSQELDKKFAQPAIFLPEMTPIKLKEKSWGSPAVKEAYAQFAKERWQYLKSNIVETDCKGLALKFMVDFRDYYKKETGITLPFPGTSKGVKEVKPEEFTSEKTHGWAEAPLDKAKRNDYDGFKKLLAADPNESLIRGTNVRFGGISADIAARKMVETIDSRAKDGKPIAQEHPAKMSMSEKNKTPEFDINQLEDGDIVFIDHTDKGESWDHAVNILDVNKRENGTVESITIAVSAFDDLNDRDSKTLPTYPNINFYAEEVVVKFDEKGKATSSNVTWSSEPYYVHDSRYSVTSTLMETRPGGKLKIGRWAD
jgi:peptidoglycan hydrolase-like protein with peptidoglycan-binding domain